jgi:hypothetical protein
MLINLAAIGESPLPLKVGIILWHYSKQDHHHYNFERILKASRSRISETR